MNLKDLSHHCTVTRLSCRMATFTILTENRKTLNANQSFSPAATMVRTTQKSPSPRVCDTGVIVQRPSPRSGVTHPVWSPRESWCNQRITITGAHFRLDPVFILVSTLVQVLNVAILSVFSPTTNSSSSCLAWRTLSYAPVFILKALERLDDFYSVSQQQL